MLQEILNVLRDKLWVPSLVEVADEKVVLANGAYEAGDVVSENVTIAAGATPWIFRNMVRKPGGAGIIHDALILAQTTAIASVFSLFLHKATPTCELGDGVPNTAFIIGDIGIAVVRIDFIACDDVGTGMSESTATPSTYGKLPKAFVCAEGSRNLQGVLAIHNAVDLADSTSLRIVLLVEQL